MFCLPDIVHRDIKLDNILLSQDPKHEADHLNIKVCIAQWLGKSCLSVVNSFVFA